MFCLVVETRVVAGAGETAGAGEGLLNWNQECLAGVGETAAAELAAVVSFLVRRGDVASVGVTDGEGAVDGLLDWRWRGCFAGVGETAAGEGEVAGEVSSFFLERLCFAGLGDAGLAAGEGDGDSVASALTENPTSVIIRATNLFITRPYSWLQYRRNVKSTVHQVRLAATPDRFFATRQIMLAGERRRLLLDDALVLRHDLPFSRAASPRRCQYAR